MTIREHIIDWITRVKAHRAAMLENKFILWLEARHIEQRQDYTERLSEKDNQIKQLRIELAVSKLECDRMRAVLMPFGSPSGAQFAQQYQTGTKPPIVPAFDGPDDWQKELNNLYTKEQSDGIHEQGREEVHEPSADDGARQVSGSSE